jgi:outer membrane usher protein
MGLPHAAIAAVLTGLWVGCFAAQPVERQDAGLALYLEVTLNQRSRGQLMPFLLRDGVLHATVGTLRELGFALDGQPADRLLALTDLPGLEIHFDNRLQRVALQAPIALLSLSTTRLQAQRSNAPALSPAAPGALFNYDLYASHGRGGSQWNAAHETRLFGFGAGVVSHTMLNRMLRAEGPGGDAWHSESVRLDSSWQFAWPERMLTLQLGDSVSGALDWSRSLRMGGVRIGSDFSLQPYRAITPQPAFYGEVAVPSTVELFVNGLKQYSGQVPPGPFAIDSRPGITGAGQAQIVISDAFGRTRTLSLPFYGTQQLLAAGLNDWSASLGRVRLDYGRKSFSYDDATVLSSSLRHGWSDRVTLEAHAEAGAGVRNGGVGGLWLLGADGTAGVLRASAAHGAWQADSGRQWALGYQWNRKSLFIDLHTQRTHGDYRDIASRYGQPPARVSDRVSTGLDLAPVGSLALSYVRLAYPQGDDARYASVSWSRQLGGRLSLSASLTRQLNDRRSLAVFFGASWRLDDGLYASAAMQRAYGRTGSSIDVSSPVQGDGGVGWRTQVRNDAGQLGAQAEASWLNRYGRLGAGAASFAGSSYGYASASGALVLMNGGLFATRDISDSFAVVSTDGLAGVPVTLENRVVGTTDADGRLLVTRLNAWQYNRIGIDPMDLPANVRVRDTEQNATPSDRAGALVHFALHPVRAALLVVHDAQGRPLPMGSRATALEDGASAAQAIVGYDGELYLDELRTHNRLRVRAPEGGATCELRFELPPMSDGIQRIGPLTCLTEARP